MSFSTADLADIKWSLGAFAASAALAAGLVTYSGTYQDNALRERQAAQKQLTEARNQFAAAQSDLENMAAYQSEYESLQAQKVIGNEPRLDWSEGLEKLRKQGIVLDFTYTIAPQQPYAPTPPLDTGNFALSLSPMTLQLDLLHEEQLLSILSAMRSQIPGWFILDRCSIAAPTSQGEVLKTECAGGWFTLKNRNSP